MNWEHPFIQVSKFFATASCAFLFLSINYSPRLIAQDYFVVGSYDSLTIQIFSGDSLISTEESGWDFPYKNGLFLHGIMQSHLISLPKVPERRIVIIDSVSTFNPFSIPQTQIVSNVEKITLEYSAIIFQAFFAGIFIAMILYNLIIYFTVKESTFIFYVLFLVLFLLVWQSVYGYTFSYLWPNSPEWNRIATFFLIILQTTVAIEFTIRYLQTEIYDPFLAKTGRALELILLFAAFILIVINSTKLFLYAALVTDLLFTIYVIPSLIKSLKNKYTPAYHYFAAFIALIISGLISVLGELGVYENTFFIKHATQFGAVLMSIIFAVGLAERINVLKKENQLRREEITVKELENRHTEAALEEKDTMLKEVHHRVKNNLQIVYSLLNLQQGQETDPKVIQTIRASQSRIKIMSLVHQELYKTNELKEVDVSLYINQLINYLSNLYTPDLPDIKIQADIPSLMIGLKTAVPLGLIINEIITNAFEHAFPDNQTDKLICVAVTLENNYLMVEIEDNGVGLEEYIFYESEALDSLGLTLIQDLVRQLKGEINISSTHGVAYHLKLPFADE